MIYCIYYHKHAILNVFITHLQTSTSVTWEIMETAVLCQQFLGMQSMQNISFLIVSILVHMEVTEIGIFPVQAGVKKRNQSDFRQNHPDQIILGYAS